MDHLYPAGPSGVPAELTAPTSNYRRHAWLAVAGLAVFVIAYLGLAGWFVWTAWRMLKALPTSGGLLGILMGVCAGFLGLFMLKALVFVKHGEASEDVELTPATEPTLFAFLHRLADETGAPRPHRVFASGRVNAAVFYDLSLANLLLPSKKNLEIGLGLVNTLNLSEFKAVLAHEFGHFAQRSMAVGRWVYVAQQIAAHIVARRDAFDSLLAKLSATDLRIAWLGWVLRLVVWSIRSLVELLFRGVVLAQRALSREMELQADLVAVSVTGSDALIHALHRLGGADDAWERAIGFAGAQFADGKPVRDVFAVHSRVIEMMREVLGDPEYGAPPQLPAAGRETHRVFAAELAAPPRMWATHPANTQREQNAKRVYVPAPSDERSAWTLFRDPAALREQVSARFVQSGDFKPVPLEESLRALEARYSRMYLKRAYRGAYLGRTLTRHVARAADLYGVAPADNALRGALDALYPEALADDVERLRELEEEHGVLEALRAGVLKTPDGIVKHRGREVTLRELPDVIESVEEELENAREALQEHDRRARTAHLAAARTFGQGWPEYLRGMVSLLHYAEHAEANLADAQGHLSNTVAVITADGNVSKKEFARLMKAAQAAYEPLAAVYAEADRVRIDRTVAKRLESETWAAALGKFEFVPPQEAAMGDWLNAAHGWFGHAIGALGALKLATLDQLLATESQVARFVRDGLKPVGAPPASSVPGEYATFVAGEERERQTKLGWWDRFQTADGFVPTTARVAVAGGIIGAVLFVGTNVGLSTVTVYNGLAREVHVQIGERQLRLTPFRHASVEVPDDAHYTVTARTRDGALIESFEADTGDSFSKYVYNVASGAALVQWTARYGTNAGTSSQEPLGAARWTSTDVDILLEDPPRSVQTKNGTAMRTVLSALAAEQPSQVLAQLPPREHAALILTHARWDETRSRFTVDWLQRAAALPQFPKVLAARLTATPRDPALLRIEQDFTSGEMHERVCERHRQLAQRAPEDPGLQYVVARCLPPELQNAEFMRLHARWPKDGWLAFAAGHVHGEEGDWDGMRRLFEQVQRSLPQMAGATAHELARVRRLQEGAEAPLGRLEKDHPELAWLQALERRVGTEPDDAPFVALRSGRLDQAVRSVRALDDQRPRIVLLVGASDGATPEQVRAALQLEPGIGSNPLVEWSALALALREGRDPARHAAVIRKYEGDGADALFAAFERLRTTNSPDETAAALRGLLPAYRGALLAAACVLRGNEAPAQWRRDAERMLFVVERPYFAT